MSAETLITILRDKQQLNEIKLPPDVFITVGRDPQCNIVIKDANISRVHATIMVREGEVFISDDGSTNQTWVNNKALAPHQFYPIITETTVALAQGSYTLRITPALKPTAGQVGNASQSQIMRLLQTKGSIILGRDPACDIHLTSLQVSRHHTVLEQKGNEYFILDLGSKNGTYVNGNKIQADKPHKITETDRITIGPYDFILRSEKPKEVGKSGFAIMADKVQKIYPGGTVGLHRMSVKIPAGSFVALMGPSGCGKSTLLKGLIGANPFTQGSVHIHGIRLNAQNFNQLKRNIGYVPQDDIIHKELTVKKTLYFAAKLRLADDVTPEEMNRKINEVLKILNIEDPDLQNKKIGNLSGGQRKRISIAVELINDPTILFLDEPTSPLDPETIGDFLSCIRKLTEKGVTVIMVTHKPSDLEYVDKVIFLSAGGHLSFFGEDKDFLNYFKLSSIIDVYALLKTPEKGKEWGSKWIKETPQSDIEPKPEKLERRSDSFFRQLYWLSLRYFYVKWSDKANIAMLLAQPIIISALICFIFKELQLGVLFLMAISAIWFGVSNSAKEIVGERPIYERERMFNLNIGGYLLSKVFVLSLIALVQCLIFVGIIYWGYHGHEQGVYLREYLPFVGAMWFISVSATFFGLSLSSVFGTTEKVMTIVPIALIPQIMLSGVISRIDNTTKELLSFFTLGRWGTELMATLQDELTRKNKNLPDVNIKCGNEISNSIQSVIVYKGCPAKAGGYQIQSIPDSAHSVLAFYADAAEQYGFENPSEVFKGLNGNFMALMILNVITVSIIVYVLKRRDKLKKSPQKQ